MEDQTSPVEGVQSFAQSLLVDPPPEVVKLIELLVNPNLSMGEIDSLMSWPVGKTRRTLTAYPLLARTANEARVLAFRNSGLEAPRLGAYKAIVEALAATKSVQTGDFTWADEPDHAIRLKAANQILKVLGDDSSATVNHIEVELHQKIYNLINQNKPVRKVIDATGTTQEPAKGLQVVR